MQARDPVGPMADGDHRLVALDLVRGIAVLGILAINIGGFAGPVAATLSPNQPEPGTWLDEAVYAFSLVVFEGKMRALFTILFGASLVLFADRVDAAGRSGDLLQFRRLGWLALAGYLHYLLFWWGDILFTYAIAGFAALAFRHAAPRPLAAAALILFAAWHGSVIASGWAGLLREERVTAGTAPPAEAAAYTIARDADRRDTARELARYRSGFVDQARAKWRDRPGEPIDAALASMGESLPLMMLGMALYRSGFFARRWPVRTMRVAAVVGIGLGGTLTSALAAWAWSRHFPPDAMLALLSGWLAIPHLLMAFGYANAALLAAPRLASTGVGRRLIATGRMAFSNYIAMTVLMTAVFYGWGFGLVGQVPERWHWLFVASGWALMLGLSKPWLARFRHGPIEWLWRSLTYGYRQPMRR